jgi:transposase-like protein
MHPGVSIAAVALHYRLNANLLRRWVADHEPQQSDAIIPSDKPMPIVNAARDFLKSAEVNFPTLGTGWSALQ